MGEMEENAETAYEFTSGAGHWLAEATGFSGVEPLVDAAAGVGVAIGTGIEYLTDGAISDTISDGLLGLVGDEHSLAAANEFDDGNYVAGVGEMLQGAGETIYDTAGDLANDAVNFAGDAWDAVTDLF